jgi:hypothetical protein
VLVALCWLTFALATVMLGGLLLVLQPAVVERIQPDLPAWMGLAFGAGLLLVIAVYVFGSWLQFKPFRIAGFQFEYPRLPIVFRQLTIGPFEILAAATIIYFALPAAGNPGFLTVAAVFVASFTVAQLSHAPGGLGVLEVVFIKGLPEMDEVHVLAALLVFRLLYLLIPLIRVDHPGRRLRALSTRHALGAPLPAGLSRRPSPQGPAAATLPSNRHEPAQPCATRRAAPGATRRRDPRLTCGGP